MPSVARTAFWEQEMKTIIDQPGALFGAGGGEELVSSESDRLPRYAVADKADAVAGVDLGLEDGTDVCYVGFDGGGRVGSALVGSLTEERSFAVHLERYSTFMNLVFQQNLQDAPTIKPILNGNDITEAFNLKSTGPFMKAALDGLIKWQFDHEGSSKDKAKSWLRTQREYLGIP
ncbi:hypothetical protein VE04_03135 [Pseudogymnoascus sp. 24MN13]|nr:hypothetical protein VE04_03135 [Pseudogymnoascus sp. 24MN13]